MFQPEHNKSMRLCLSLSLAVCVVFLFAFPFFASSLFTRKKHIGTVHATQTSEPANQRTNEPTNQRTSEPANQRTNERAARALHLLVLCICISIIVVRIAIIHDMTWHRLAQLLPIHLFGTPPALPCLVLPLLEPKVNSTHQQSIINQTACPSISISNSTP